MNFKGQSGWIALMDLQLRNKESAPERSIHETDIKSNNTSFYPIHLRVQALNIFQAAVEKDLIKSYKGRRNNHEKCNVLIRNMKAIKELQHNTDIVIHKADHEGK